MLLRIKLLPIKIIDNAGRKKKLLPIEFIGTSHNSGCLIEKMCILFSEEKMDDCLLLPPEFVMTSNFSV